VYYLLPIYRAVSGYPQVLEEGSPEILRTLSGEALHEQAWQLLVGPHFNVRRNEARERFYAMASQEKSSNRLTEVLVAAVDGRIETSPTACANGAPSMQRNV
jgi:hypothetical protein